MLTITPIPAFSDNYIWCIHNQTHAAIVDPGDASPVFDYLQSHPLNLSAILITHHHHDHTGGVAKLIKNFPVPVYAPQKSQLPQCTFPMVEGNTVFLDTLNLALQVLETPGHTLDHIVFKNHDNLFCGDTLFSSGCGRVFEGTHEQLFQSLKTLASLPDSTHIYCAHEYTQANIAFALTIEPDNSHLIAYAKAINQSRENHLPSLPSTIAREKQINPFLRCHEPSVIDWAEKQLGEHDLTPLRVFTAIRKAKNQF